MIAMARVEIKNKEVIIKENKGKSNKSEWERIVRKALSKQEEVRAKQIKRQIQEYVKRVKVLISLPVILTIIAAIIMIFRFGFEEFERTILGWVIGTSFISIIFTLFEANKIKRIIR